MSELMYVGANLPATTGTRDVIINITEDNIEDYFTITNGTYTFVGSNGVFTSNNKSKSGSTAQITLVAKQAMSNFKLNYTYSTEASFDKFTFTYNSTTKANAVSGTGSGTFSQALASGDKLIFKYVKDSSQDKNDDICTFSNIQFSTTETYDNPAKDNAAKVVAAAYIGVNDVAKKVKKAYIGVNGVAQMCYNKSFGVYTVNIKEGNSNPETCCTYADDAVGMEKGSSAWDKIFGYKPCIMKDGTVVGYLNRDDFSKYEDGSNAPITDSNYDVMIEFPRRGLKISKNENNVITISLTDNLNDENFTGYYHAHMSGTETKNYFYLGAYFMTGSSSKVGSNSGGKILTSISQPDFVNYAAARGSGYYIMSWFQWIYIQALYILKYGNLNSQAALGLGGLNATNNNITGTTDTEGMCYGDVKDSDKKVKLFGLEDAFGNYGTTLDGIYYSGKTLYPSIINGGKSWSYTQDFSTDTGGYITRTAGTNTLGFTPTAMAGASTAWYCDNGGYTYDANILNSYVLSVGGGGASGPGGIFMWFNSIKKSVGGNALSARLMYL